MSNKDDLQAINDYVKNRSAPAAGAPDAVVRKWEALKSQWDRWYPGVISSFYVSDSDLSHGKAIRNALMQNQNPDAWQWAKEVAADQPGRKAYADRPDAPVSGKKPWERKGLTYSGKLKSAADVKALQQRINAAGYQPPLKVDGKYGKATQAGEMWLNRQKPLEDAAAKDAAKEVAKDPAAQAVAMLGGKPKPKPAPPPATTKPADADKALAAPYHLLGVPVNAKSVLSAVAGTAAGWLAGGPVGAAIGIPAGWFGSKLIPEKKP